MHTANRSALKALAAELIKIADAPPDENYHCHTRMHLSNEEARFESPVRKNAWVVLSEPIVSLRPVPLNPEKDADGGYTYGLDLTFMHVSETALDELATHQETGVQSSSFGTTRIPD